MDIFEEAEMELGCEPGELVGTFPARLVDKATCQHDNLTPHRTWDTGQWYWTCNGCYEHISNQWVTDRMRNNGQ